MGMAVADENVEVEGGAKKPVEEPEKEEVESFFQIPDGTKIPPEGIALMDGVGKEWQKRVTQAMQAKSDENKELKNQIKDLHGQLALDEKDAQSWRVAAQSPDFMKFYDTIRRGEEYKPTQQPAPPQDDYGDMEGGDQLRQFSDNLESKILSGVTEYFDKRLAPIEKMVGQSQLNADMVALEGYAKKVNGPDPNDERVQKQMSFLRGRYPQLPLHETYDLARVKLGQLEPMQNSVQDSQGEEAKVPVTIPPRGTAVVSSPLQGKSPLELAQEDRKKGVVQRASSAVKDKLLETISEYAGRTGNSATIDDLSR